MSVLSHSRELDPGMNGENRFVNSVIYYDSRGNAKRISALELARGTEFFIYVSPARLSNGSICPACGRRFLNPGSCQYLGSGIME